MHRGVAVLALALLGACQAQPDLEPPSTSPPTGSPLHRQQSLGLGGPPGSSWTAASALATARAEHTVTLLSDGRALLVGGRVQAVVASSALATTTTVATCDGGSELYDPSTDSWSAATSGADVPARYGHTATALQDGRVLIAGGVSPNSTTLILNSGVLSATTGSLYADAWLYDPRAGTFTVSQQSMHTARYHHTATLLTNGQVLVAGGDDRVTGGDPLSSLELYDPPSDTWTQLGAALQSARELHTATWVAALERLYLVDGTTTGGTPLASAEIIDFSSGSPVVLTAAPQPSTPRSDHTATLVGTLLVIAGGLDTNNGGGGAYLATGEYLDLTSPTNTWQGTGNNLPSPAVAPMASLLPNGTLVILGGESSANGDSNLEIQLNALSKMWMGGGGPTNLLTSRDRATVTVLGNGQLLVTGGETSPGGAVTNLTERLDPTSPSWPMPNPYPALPQARLFPTATLLLNDEVLVAGGEDANFDTLNAMLYLPDGGALDAGASADFRTRHTATLLTTGQVLVTGGLYPDAGLVASAELYDPVAGAFAATGSMNAARMLHAAALLGDGRVLIAGGTSLSFVGTATAELFDPATGAFTSAPPMGVARGGLTLTLLRDGRVLALGGAPSAEVFDPHASTWTDAGTSAVSAPFNGRFLPGTAILSSGKVIVAGGLALGDSGPIKGGDGLTSVELYDPATGTFSPLNDAPGKAGGARLTVLPNDQVLLVGGADHFALGSGTLALAINNAHSQAAEYDLQTGLWSPVSPPGGVAPTLQGQALLPTGRVLVAGGNEASVVAFDEGRGFTNDARPILDPIQGSQPIGPPLDAGGSRLTYRSEAAGGNPQSSASNGALLRLEREDSQQAFYPPVLAATPYPDAGFSLIAATDAGVMVGVYWVRPVTAGIDGVAVPVVFLEPNGAPCVSNVTCLSGTCGSSVCQAPSTSSSGSSTSSSASSTSSSASSTSSSASSTSSSSSSTSSSSSSTSSSASSTSSSASSTSSSASSTSSSGSSTSSSSASTSSSGSSTGSTHSSSTSTGSSGSSGGPTPAAFSLGGCGCRSSSGSDLAGWTFGLLALALRRRRSPV